MYAVRLSIPPNTLVSSPASVNLDISPGTARRVRVVIPSGCVDLVGVWITYRSSRIWPLNDDGFFLGNGNPIDFYPNTELFEPPFVLTINGYNEDDTYAHSPSVYVELDFLGGNSARERGLLQSIFGALAPRTDS